MANDDWVEVDIEIEFVTQDSIKVVNYNLDSEEIWIAKSLIREDENFLPGRSYTIEVPEWLAIQENLV